jgi:hypothetical protein
METSLKIKRPKSFQLSTINSQQPNPRHARALPEEHQLSFTPFGYRLNHLVDRDPSILRDIDIDLGQLHPETLIRYVDIVLHDEPVMLL